METPNKDGKSLPMLTPKNSDGSQRVIKQIMVIDPNKLRVAGLDLKMAEALKKSKGSRGSAVSSRTKDDKLALAKTILNRKLKQAKSSSNAQNKNVTKETCDSPHKLQASVAALQSLLAQPRTYVAPSPKKPHTMLVNIVENDQRTGSIELSISNKSHVQQEKQVVEPIPKASIKMTKPVKIQEPTPKTIESMVIAPEVKFEIKRKSLPPNPKRECSDAQSNLPQVIESKVLSPEEKIDMKTLCGSSTKPVPAKVKIEITKQEILQRISPVLIKPMNAKETPEVPQITKHDIVHRMPPAQVNAPKETPRKGTTAPEIIKHEILHRKPSPQLKPVNANENPKEEVVVPEITKQDIFQRLTPAQLNATNPKQTPKKIVIVPEVGTASPQVVDMPKEVAIVTALTVSSDKRSHSTPKHVPKKKEVKDESAVDFINSLQMNSTTNHKKTPQKVEPSAVQEDATSFLLSLFGQQPFTPILTPEVMKTVEAKAVATVEEPVKREEPSKQQSKVKPEKDSTTQVYRRNVKPVPIMKQRPRVAKAAKVSKPESEEKVVSVDELPTSATTANKEISESSASLEKVDCSQGSTANAPDQGDKTDSGEKRNKESLDLEMKSAGLSSTTEAKNSMGDSEPRSIGIPKHEEVNTSSSVTKLVEKETVRRSISTEVERTVVVDGFLGIHDKLVRKHTHEDSVNKAISNDKEPLAANASDSAHLEVVQTNVVDMAAPKEECSLKNTKSKDADHVVRAAKQSDSEVQENSAKTVDKVDAKKLGSTDITKTVESVQKSVVDVKCDSSGAFAKSDISTTATVDGSEIHKTDAPVENKIVPTHKPVECSKPELIQSPVQVDIKKTDPITEDIQPTEPKVETVPSVPQASARRKSKKSVPILIAKLSRSRKPASAQEKPKEKEAQATPAADKTSCARDESVEANNESGDAATSQNLSKPKESTNTMDEVDAMKVDPKKKDKDEEVGKAISDQPEPPEDIPQEPLQNRCEPVTNVKPTTSIETEETETIEKTIVTSSQSESPCSESRLHEAREETVTKDEAVEIDSPAVTKEIAVTSKEKIGKEPLEETVIELPTEPMPIVQPQQCANEENQLSSPNKLSEEKTCATLESPQKNIADKYQQADETATEVTEETTCVLKDEISNTVLWTEAKTRRYSRVRKKCPDLNDHKCSASASATTETASVVPFTEAEKSVEAATTQEASEVTITEAEKSVDAATTEAAITDAEKSDEAATTTVSSEVPITEAEQSDEAATTEIASEVTTTDAETLEEPGTTEAAITDAEKSDEAVSDIESPRIESPIPKIAPTTKESECDQQEGVQSTRVTEDIISIPVEKAVKYDSNWTHDFDMIREKEVVKNETISLPTASVVNDDDDDSSDELVIDEDYHCDSDFMEPFQDDTEIGVTSHVDKPSPKEPAVDFESLKSADKPLCEKPDKTLHESNEDLDFLGFNEKEIEEGHQSTSLRLSQSEDITPLKALSLSEATKKKKTAPQFKKIPLSVAKKQKAEQQKNWKKNSAKSLQNWLKLSEKEASVKEDETSLVDTKSADKMGKTAAKEKDRGNDTKQDSSAETSAQDKDLASNNLGIVAETSAKEKELDCDCKQDSLSLGKDIALPDQVENNLAGKAITPSRGKKKKGKQEEVVTEKKNKPKKPSKRSLKTEKEVEVKKESAPVTEPNSTEERRESQSNTPRAASAVESDAVESKSGNKSSARGQKKKSKRKEEDACATGGVAKEPKSSSKTTKKPTLDEHFPKLDESAEVKPPSEPIIREQKRKSKGSALEVPTDPVPSQTTETCSKTTKRKLEMDFEEPSKDVAESQTPTPAAPAKKRKYVRKSLKEPVTPTASETSKTPKSSRSLKTKDISKQVDVEKDLSQSVDTEVQTPSLTEPNARKRKASKCDTETPSKVAHISADTDCTFLTPTPKRRGPKKREMVDTPEIVITPQSEKKYKNSTEFNPRLLLIRTKEEFKSDAPLVDPTLQTVPKSKDDVQCALCMGYTPKKRWLQHISDHYGVGWPVGSAPPLNISCRSAVLNYMVEFFKTSKVKGLNCRICNVLRRSALGLLSHIEQCCLTEEELKDTRVTCEHCKKDYSKSSMPSHLRSCPEIWKKRKPEPEAAEQADEKEAVLSNTGRLKRKSVIKAEHKFKDLDDAEVSPDEFIKHIPQPRKDHYIAAWQRDIKSFGKGFCTEKKCQFTAGTVEELEQHCQEGVCPHFLQPGYFCMRCKYRSSNVESTRKHVLEKHIIKPSEDFQASEDDAVISPESSSEDGSSGDEEASEKSTADHDVSAKPKKKRKSNSSRSRGQNTVKRNSTVKDIRRLVPHPTANVSLEVARLHQDFINHNYSQTALFSYAAPNASQILDDDAEPYFPKSALSPKFVLNGFTAPFVNALGSSRVEPDQWQQLQRLNGMGTATEHVMYLGGPVKAIAWVPLMPHTTTEFQYLASVTRKDSNKFSRYLQPKQSRSLVCIHRYQVTGTEETQIAGEIYYALAIDDGPIHCIEFLPSGGYDPEMNRLGLLAVGTVASEVKVYSLPLNVQKRDCDMFPILRIEPSFVLGLELDERDPTEYYTSHCASLSWSQFAGHCHIVAGYVNGFVSIWDIADDDDNLNRFLVDGVRKFVPISYFWSKDDRIRGVSTHYDMNGLRWLGVCNTPRELVFYDLRDITKPIQIMEERAKNDCNAIDWPVVWPNPAFALGDAMPTHGACLSTISPTALGYVTKKFERFCTGVTDLHYSPWHNMYVAGSENGDLQITPLRDTVMDVSCRRKKEEKIITSLDLVPLNGDAISDCMTQSSHVFETDYNEKYGIVFGPIQEITTMKLPELYSPKRVPPLVLSRLSRIHRVRFNPNQKKNTFLAVGYVNGFVRILVDKWKEPVLILSR